MGDVDLADDNVIRIGGASGYWGESDMAVPQFLRAGNLDYIVFDYLAEITMSIMARARNRNPDAGYATDFVSAALKPNLKEIARQGIKILSNAGGVNPVACGNAVRALVREAGLDLKVAVVTGDDLLPRAGELAQSGLKDMFDATPFPEPDRLASINAYLGAFPIAAALAADADIVITGRCVDSAVTLGACIHEFGWQPDDYDALARGSLAGHVLECGPQATGGNFTDWHLVADTLDTVGYPIAEIDGTGNFVTTKAAGTGGLVSIGTVGEQILYEIGDPQAYMLPDVVCDFSDVQLTEIGPDRVRVSGARGHGAPATYKICSTYEDGWRAGTNMFFYGEAAADKALNFAENTLKRARAKLRAANAADYSETLVELIGDESVYGDFKQSSGSRSVAVKIAAKHEDQRAAGLLLKEIAGHGLAAPPGLSGFSGGRAKPSPVLRLFSFTIPKPDVKIELTMDGKPIAFTPDTGKPFYSDNVKRPAPPDHPAHSSNELVPVPLIRLAWARSGDKGDKANIGVLPRDKTYAGWIWASLTEEAVADRFKHYLCGKVERFYMPGSGAINFVLDQVLGGGGVASLRNDPQGKGYSQILLQSEILIPQSLAEAI
ncbi:MAG: terpene utilization protein AtuA [Hyphomonadaceae bacterium]|nr:terpene utilization protein AtuA [Hyphomonadaceae bacterium]OUX94073.1 MAG: terpene utilization protein AtuA [Hyphomonas sp. TMED17]